MRRSAAVLGALIIAIATHAQAGKHRGRGKAGKFSSGPSFKRGAPKFGPRTDRSSLNSHERTKEGKGSTEGKSGDRGRSDRFEHLAFDDEFGGEWVFERPSKPKIPRELRLPKKVITGADGFEAHRFPIRVAILGRGDAEAGPSALPEKVREFGRLVAGKRYPLVTGGGQGLPREAEKAAHDHGGETWAVSAAKDVDDQIDAVYDVSATSVLYPTGTGGGAGSIEREAPLVQLANIRTYWNGGPGTFGELIAGLHEPGVLALSTESGGVAGHAPEEILPFVGVPSNVRVVASRDPQRLLDRAEMALGDLQRRGLVTSPSPTTLFSPKPHQSVVPASKRQSRVVMSFLLDDGGRSDGADRAKTFRLVDQALRAQIKGKPAFLVAGDNPLSRAAVLRASVDHDVGGVLVSHEGGEDSHVRATDKTTGHKSEETILIRRTGKGPGVGEFASQREVVEHADVIFVTSAYFKNLSGLAFALRQSKSSVIAVLELELTRSSHLKEILRSVKGGYLGERFIFESDPARLVKKAKERVEERDRPGKSSSWSFGFFRAFGLGGESKSSSWSSGRRKSDAGKSDAGKPDAGKPDEKPDEKPKSPETELFRGDRGYDGP